ncbi:DNA polymerase-3 subunit alpha [Mariprofundus ferrinatatus]|uniref:DNA polymerase III subunit alpha n=1 Tax=Mariprofundus ferrinatatus TaxID=1921087 RepID=A0A2K8L4E1_9PROT|nr:DNA polymerase III subunit alpha [Mariprofundus ferrinatatus]ATX81109.1 DNA polymerase-3 subunit alpha [Mariprofundus ferrinatatus]
MHFAPFAHLHNHSDFSLLGATTRVSELLKRVAELKQPAVALTDYGNLFGAIEFYSKAMQMGIKPILGCEIFLCDDHTKRISEGPRGPRFPQLVLLARNNTGWKNLLKLISISYIEGFYYKPRVGKPLLAEHCDGLIALSSGWNGEVEQLLQKGDRTGATAAARAYKEMFHENCFFLELQRHGNGGQEEINRQLIEIAHELDIPLVASNNTHFIERDGFNSFEAMLALQQNRTIHDDVTGIFTPEHYLKSFEEMQDLFSDIPEALENSMHIANRCNVDLRFGNYQLPDFQPPEDLELNAYMRKQAQEGLDLRWPTILAGEPEADRDVYDKRLQFELDIIEKMGFPGYFLIVSDFILWAKNHGIPVGPGRGSGAGSLVAYVLKITDLDPIKYGLLFERFLNPERVSMPDFDIDFCMSRREEVIRYVTEKYGEAKVAQIITYGSMKAKAVVRDVGRVLGMDLAKVNLIAKLIPNDLKMTLEKALVEEPKLAKMVDDDHEVAHLFELARRLEGCHRNAGKHAAGVIIGRQDLDETAPLFKVAGEEGKVVQWDMGNSEKMGLIKFDFLGLKTLTVIDIACKLIKRYDPRPEAQSFDITAIPMDDQATFNLMQRGQTGAVFQVESSGMRDLLTRLRPDCFEDIIALVALYRPGPLESGMVDTYIECKHGRQEIVYLVPQLKEILQETNGVILYQEQVMQIAQVLAGYTLGQADMLRRAMGKKKPEEMAKQRQIFMKGAEKKKVPLDRAEQIFDLMEKFAGYGFNKSHSAAYALISYQTAYLKAHYPQAFMAATLSCDMGNTDKVAALVTDCRNMDIEVLPPHINASDWEFRPEEKAIRYGLGAIKGVGEAAIRAVVAERKENGPFESFEELIMRSPTRTLNKRILEALIKAAALEGLIPNQRAAIEGLSEVLEQLSRKRKEYASNQSTLFEVAEPQSGEGGFPLLASWSHGEQLQAEREVLGFYLTGHPLEAYLKRFKGLGDCNLSELRERAHESQIVVPVGISGIRPYNGRSGTMAFVQVEDLHGQAEMIVFAKLYAEVSELLASDEPLLIAAKVDTSKDDPVLIAEAISSLDDILPELVHEVQITAASIAWDEVTLARLKSMATGGSARLAFHVRLPDASLAQLITGPCINWSEAVRTQLDARFGVDSIRVRCKPWQPPRSQQMRRG